MVKLNPSERNGPTTFISIGVPAHHAKTPSLPSTFSVLWPSGSVTNCGIYIANINQDIDIYIGSKLWIYCICKQNLWFEGCICASDWYRSELWIWKDTKITHVYGIWLETKWSYVSIDANENHLSNPCRNTSSECIMTLLNYCETQRDLVIKEANHISYMNYYNSCETSTKHRTHLYLSSCHTSLFLKQKYRGCHHLLSMTRIQL